MGKTKKLFFLVDMDGCAIHSLSHEINPALLKIMNQQIQAALSEGYQAVEAYVGSASRRHFLSTEKLNHDRYLKAGFPFLSSAEVIENIAGLLRDNFKGSVVSVSVSCVTLLMADLGRSKTFEALQASRKVGCEWARFKTNEESDITTLPERDDGTKISMLFALLQWIGHEHSGLSDPSDVIFFDDRSQDIIPLVQKVFRAFPEWIPQNLLLKTCLCIYGTQKGRLVHFGGAIQEVISATDQAALERRSLPTPHFPVLQLAMAKRIRDFLPGQDRQFPELLDSRDFLLALESIVPPAHLRAATLASPSRAVTIKPADFLFRLCICYVVEHLERVGDGVGVQKKLRLVQGATTLASLQAAILSRRHKINPRRPISRKLIAPLLQMLQDSVHHESMGEVKLDAS